MVNGTIRPLGMKGRFGESGALTLDPVHELVRINFLLTFGNEVPHFSSRET
jgi:hypothetical protein